MDGVTVDENRQTPPQRPGRGRGRGGPKDPLGPDSEIGSRLRELYAEVEQEPIPLQLIELLERLSEVEGKLAK